MCELKPYFCCPSFLCTRFISCSLVLYSYCVVLSRVVTLVVFWTRSSNKLHDSLKEMEQ